MANPKSLDDITLDMVIMAPEMIEVIEDDSEEHQTVTVYTVEEDWAVECDHREKCCNIYRSGNSKA